MPNVSPPSLSRRGRDRRIDTLRGLLLVVMTIDHLGGPLSRYTFEAPGFVSAFEGFVLLSGFMLALVIPGLDGVGRTGPYVLARLWKLYRYQVGLIAGCMALMAVSALHAEALRNWTDPYLSDAPRYFALQLVLLHQAVYLDILPLYLLLIAASPLALWAFRRGRADVVIGASVLLWAGGHLGDPLRSAISLLCPTCRPGTENVLAFQIIWTAGLYCGFRARIGRPVLQEAPRWALPAAAAVTLVLFAVRHELISVGDLQNAVSRQSMGWLRLLNVAALATLVASLAKRLPSTAGLPWIAFLGRYSLQVFAFHVLVVYALMPVRELATGDGGVATALAITVAVVASLTLPAVASRWLQRPRMQRVPAAEA